MVNGVVVIVKYSLNLLTIIELYYYNGEILYTYNLRKLFKNEWLQRREPVGGWWIRD